MIPHMAEVLAQLHGVTPEEIARVTEYNARNLFRLDA